MTTLSRNRRGPVGSLHQLWQGSACHEHTLLPSVSEAASDLLQENVLFEEFKHLHG